ncbi:hypothetical protein V9J15_05200 [Candidatus Liberibacter africanus]|uniref:hypothetical protein n=1 Tax=Liberibacter africanus TaxID=34020 RepID=UPI00339D9968
MGFSAIKYITDRFSIFLCGYLPTLNFLLISSISACAFSDASLVNLSTASFARSVIVLGGGGCSGCMLQEESPIAVKAIRTNMLFDILMEISLSISIYSYIFVRMLD